MIKFSEPALILAPMEGVTDAPMRATLSERGGFTHCVSEFLRVSQDVPPARTFTEYVPELKQGCHTPSGIPVQIQILGGDPEKLAKSALVALMAGAPGIDLNFGCPAPTVNRHDGGATLLKHPDRIRAIVEAVRGAVPKQIPVSAKIRLGWESIEDVHRNADAAAQGGASWITIHARTRMQAYQPPVFWGKIGQVRAALAPLPIIANGDIWTLEDFHRCREITGAKHFMLGRSAVADPNLPLQVARELGLPAPEVEGRFAEGASDEWIPLLRRFAEWTERYAEPGKGAKGYALNRMKQWLRMSRLNRGEAAMPWFNDVKRAMNIEEIYDILALNAQGTHGHAEFLSNASA